MQRVLNRSLNEDLVALGHWENFPSGGDLWQSVPHGLDLAQWTRLLDVVMRPGGLAVMLVTGTLISDRLHTALLKLIAQRLPDSSVIALNVGEMNADAEAYDALESAVAKPSCVLGHLYFRDPVSDSENARKQRVRVHLRHNRSKPGYLTQLARDDVWTLQGANCWWNFHPHERALALKEHAFPKVVLKYAGKESPPPAVQTGLEANPEPAHDERTTPSTPPEPEPAPDPEPAPEAEPEAVPVPVPDPVVKRKALHKSLSRGATLSTRKKCARRLVVGAEHPVGAGDKSVKFHRLAASTTLDSVTQPQSTDGYDLVMKYMTTYNTSTHTELQLLTDVYYLILTTDTKEYNDAFGFFNYITHVSSSEVMAHLESVVFCMDKRPHNREAIMNFVMLVYNMLKASVPAPVD